jgi:hypothetical protein
VNLIEVKVFVENCFESLKHEQRLRSKIGQDAVIVVELGRYYVIFVEMTTIAPVKKEIRLKVASKFYNLLEDNANRYGLKPNEYLVHLILDDIKKSAPPFLSEASEEAVDEAYQERKTSKKAKAVSAGDIMKLI